MSAPESATWSLTARYIFPVDGPPLENGVVVIKGDRLLAIGPKNSHKADVYLGNAAVVPGLVNAHTHLDLTGLRGKIAFSGSFVDWLTAVIEHRRRMTVDDVQRALLAGILECGFVGTTLVGDIAGAGLSWDMLEVAPLRSVVFYELLGLTEERANQAWDAAQVWLAAAHSGTPRCRPGLSPHAPYSVRTSLFGLASNASLPVSIHLAETRDELRLLKDRDGPFREFLTGLGVWDEVGLAASVSEIVRLNSQVKNLLLIHGTYLEGQDLPYGATVVYCPRTHAYFGHPPHPFRQMVAGGVRVAIGTDSLASNPDLDVLAEVRFLRQRYPDLPGHLLLRMATLNGAEALGWADETGSLTPGKSADLAVVPLPNLDRRDPHTLLLEGTEKVKAVLFRGKWIHS
jgi:cytosine/adenosine deaminase-related metal-dependent hydrolase